MTIKQKAKAYDEALEIAKKNYDVAQDLCNKSQIGVECFKNILTNIFPELQESEDEKIRKWLIDWANAVNWSEQFTISKEQVLAWLEKQGDPNPYSGTSFKYNGHTWGMCARDNGVEVMIDRKLVEFINPDNYIF